MKEYESDINLNTFMYSAINIIFQKIIDNIEQSLEIFTKSHKKLSEKVDRARRNFEPYVNCVDSHFNNYLDETNIFDLPSCAGEEYVKLIKEW
jgi:hypothetical protein